MKFTLYKDQVGEWRWNLKASNGRIVADCGEGYKRFGSMVRTLRRIFGGYETHMALDQAIVDTQGR